MTIAHNVNLICWLKNLGNINNIMARFYEDKTIDFEIFGFKIFSIVTNRSGVSYNIDSYEDDLFIELNNRKYKENKEDE